MTEDAAAAQRGTDGPEPERETSPPDQTQVAEDPTGETAAAAGADRPGDPEDLF